jgi:hypothetical protein
MPKLPTISCVWSHMSCNLLKESRTWDNLIKLKKAILLLITGYYKNSERKLLTNHLV